MTAEAINAATEDHGGVALELEAEADGSLDYGRDEAAPELEAVGTLRRSRREHPLAAGIRMFTAMLDEAKGGYIVDRLEEVEEAIGIEFTAVEQDGIIQVASARSTEDGIPDVEHAVGIALAARVDAGDLRDTVPAAALDEQDTPDADEPEDEDDEFADAPGPEEDLSEEPPDPL